jgi:hypothetical protein
VDEGGVAGAEDESCRALPQQELLHGVHGHWHCLTARAAGAGISGGSGLLLHEILEQEDAVLQLPPHLTGIIACGVQQGPPAATRKQQLQRRLHTTTTGHSNHSVSISTSISIISITCRLAAPPPSQTTGASAAAHRVSCAHTGTRWQLRGTHTWSASSMLLYLDGVISALYRETNC